MGCAQKSLMLVTPNGRDGARFLTGLNSLHATNSLVAVAPQQLKTYEPFWLA